MKDKRKAAPTGSGNTLAGEQISYCKYSHRSGKSKRKIHFSDTQSQAFVAIQRLHETEMRKARKFFLEHPTRTYSRADLVEALKTADKPHYADCVRPARCRIYSRNR